MADRIRDLEDALDAALNRERMLRAQLAVQTPLAASSAVNGSERLHTLLDRLQALTPQFVRRLVRGIYLKHFYYPLFPDRRPEAVHEMAASAAPAPPAHSGYAPFVLFKQRLNGTLNLDCGVTVDGTIPGLVSVVLPVYSGERYVAASIESVLAQDYPRFELILVDDGSTGSIPEILDRFARDPRVTLVRQDNRKLPAALNAGFARARGEFFTWTSDDNLMHPTMLSTLVDFLTERRDVEMVYADEELIDAQGQPALHADFCKIHQTPAGGNVLQRPFDPGELNFTQNNFIGACFLYRAWAGRAIGEYSTACFGFEDYDYWLRMNALFRLAHLGRRQPLYRYRLHAASLTAREKELRIAERAGYSLALEAERREEFAGGFDVTFIGGHPWFRSLERAYKRAGHNVMNIPAVDDDALYVYRATRAYRKALLVGAGAEIAAALRENNQRTVTAALLDGRLTMPGLSFSAAGPEAIEYPLLAAANSLLWSRDKRPEVP